MRTEDATFFSDGLRLRGSFYLPDGPDDGRPRPLVVACSGFTGLNSIHPARFARYLTARGFLCFGFDYRGFADSEGERNRVVLEEQVRDVFFAVAFAAADRRVDPDGVFLLGWGMGAGIVLDAARQRPGLAGIIAANGFYCGERVQRAHRGDAGFEAYRAAVLERLAEQARRGDAPPVDAFDAYPLDPQSRAYVDSVLRKNPDYEGATCPFDLAWSLLRWRPEAHAPYLDVPLLIAHGDRNELHPPAEAESLLRLHGGPSELFWIEGAGHTEFMHDDHPTFQALGAGIVRWLRKRTAAP